MAPIVRTVRRTSSGGVIQEILRHLGNQQDHVALTSATQIAEWESSMKNLASSSICHFGFRLQAAPVER